MNAYRPKLWTAVGAAALLAAGCTPAKPDEAPAAAPAPSSAPVGEAGETAGGEGGGGEAGTSEAYGAVPAESRTALRIAHLRGFFLIAQEVLKSPDGGPEAAAALAGQGMLEVFDPAAAAFRSTGLNEAKLRAAAERGDAASLQAAIAELDQARRRTGGDPAAVINGMVSIAAGLYTNVVVDGSVDPMEYQHSRGAALSALGELQHFGGGNGKAQAVKADLERFLKLWPGVDAPEDAAKASTPAAVQAQASRIQLALS
ncbi:MAG: hypothetical protein K1X35_10375 [Caulobacteraceae bacterium]|nr:hypothetical protein [Caulobacteraceae bacterium]